MRLVWYAMVMLLHPEIIINSEYDYTILDTSYAVSRFNSAATEEDMITNSQASKMGSSLHQNGASRN